MRKLVWFASGFCAACFFCAYFYSKQLFLFAWIPLLVSVVSYFAAGWKKAFRFAAVLCLGISVGLAGFWIFDRQYLQRVRVIDGKTEKVLIVADDYSVTTDYGCVFEGTVYFDNIPYRVWTYLNDNADISPGDLIEGTFRFRFAADGGDDVAPQHRGKGVFLIASAQGEWNRWSGVYFMWYHYPSVWRGKLKALLERVLPPDVSAFAKGLLLGDKTDIDFETDIAFKISGISHIIAVSGLHVSILFGLIYLISARRRVLTALIGIPIVILFAAVAGFTPSVTRASLMQILMMLALLFNKEYDPPTALAFAVQVILCVNPLTVTSVSFQLSVACMAGIFSFSNGIRGWLMDKKRLGRWKESRFVKHICNWFAGSVSITIGSMFFTTPLCAYYFGMVSLVGVLTNLLTLWVVTAAFYGIMAVCALCAVSVGAGSVLAWIVAWFMRYVITVAKLLASFPFAAVYTQSTYTIIWIVFCYVLLIIFLLMKRKPTVVFSSLGVIGLLISMAVSWVEPAVDHYRVTVLNVGQGQSIILQSEGRTFLVDCGGDYEENAANIAANTLLSQGITKLDGVILTHFDADHAGGMPYLLHRMDTELLYVPNIIDEQNMTERIAEESSAVVSVVKEDTSLSFGNCKLTMFASESYNSGNESSMCILFQTENCDILITGDRGEKGEEVFLSRHDLPDLEILVVGHHGAASSASELLLRCLSPEYAVISVGEGNPYGHPSAEVLDRLEQFGCTVYRTDRDGCVIFRG